MNYPMEMSDWKFQSSCRNDDPYKDSYDIIQNLEQKYLNSYSQIEKQEYLSLIVSEIRKINQFPVRYFNDDEIIEMINEIIEKDEVYFKNGGFCAKEQKGNILLDFLFPNLHSAMTYSYRKSAFDIFYDDESLKECIEIYLNRKSNNFNGDLRRIFFSSCRYYFSIPINFSPLRAKAIFEYFCPQGGTIYDYSCGYGGRMLGALSSKNNFKYIGAEPNSHTYNNLQKLGEYIKQAKPNDNVDYKIYKTGSEDLQLPSNSIDFAFSCPPFYNKEIYSLEDTQSIIKYKDYFSWLNEYVKNTIKNCYLALKEDGIFAFNIIDFSRNGKKYNLVNDWTQLAIQQGFYYFGKFPIYSKTRTTPEEGHRDFIYVFTKKQTNNNNDLNRNKNIKITDKTIRVCEYNIFGELEKIYFENDFWSLEYPLKEFKKYSLFDNNKYYRINHGDKPIEQQLDVKKPVAKIESEYFFSYSDMARYCNVSRQAVQQAKKRNKNKISGKDIEWYD